MRSNALFEWVILGAVWCAPLLVWTWASRVWPAEIERAVVRSTLVVAWGASVLTWCLRVAVAAVSDPMAPWPPESVVSLATAGRAVMEEGGAAWWAFARVVWAAGSALLLARLFHSAVAAWRLAHTAVAQPEWGINVRVHARVRSPVTVGRVVLLPAHACTWAPATRQMVLAHEQAHVRTGDFWWQCAAQLYAALVWWSPLGWWMLWRLRALDERCADQAVLRADARVTALAYARVLLTIASHRTRGLAVPMARGGALTARVSALLSPSRPPQRVVIASRMVGAAVVLASTMAVTTVSAARERAHALSWVLAWPVGPAVAGAATLDDVAAARRVARARGRGVLWYRRDARSGVLSAPTVMDRAVAAVGLAEHGVQRTAHVPAPVDEAERLRQSAAIAGVIAAATRDQRLESDR
jgi:hypothetical protein